MTKLTWTTVAALLAVFCCGSLAAQETLLSKFHPDKKEADIAKEWFEKKLPAYIKGLVETNQFPRTYLIFPGRDRTPKPCEIRDMTRNGFRAYQHIADDQDNSGKISYRVAKEGVEFTFAQWPPQFLIDTYPVRTTPDEADIVAVAVWLYSINQPRLANRVLTMLHQKGTALRPLVEGYIILKEKLKAQPGQLELFNEWDSEFQLERNVLVTADDKIKLITERENAAKKRLEEIRANRGDYKGDPARRSRPPRRILLLVEWDIKEFKRVYAGTDLIKDKKTTDLLDEIVKSIESDRQVIKTNRDKAHALTSSGESADLKKRAQILELVLKLDPEDVRLLADVAAAWFDYARPEGHSNFCMHEEGAKNAVKFYDRILEKFPDNTSYMINKAKCFQVQGDGKAREIYKRVIELDGENSHNGQVAKNLMTMMDQRDRQRFPDRERSPKK